MTLLIIFLFCLFPIISMPIIIFMYIKDHKRRKIYGFLLALIFGLVAYNFMPPTNYDLYRYHAELSNYYGMQFSDLMLLMKYSSEQLTMLIEYFVANCMNANSLQFIIVTIGYSILFYILSDYSKKIDLGDFEFALVFLFTVTSFNFINFASGLWNYFAMLIFALGFYWDYIGKKNKVLCYIIYLSTIFIHSSMIFPIAILFLSKIFKGKFNLWTIIILAIMFLIPTYILDVINSISGISIFSQLSGMYQAYFVNNDSFMYLYSTKFIILELSKLVLYFMIYCISFKDKQNINNFIIILIISIIFLILNSILFLRFITLLQFVGSIMLMNFFKNKKRDFNLLFIIYIIICIIAFVIYQYSTFIGLDFNGIFSKNIYDNIYLLLFR